VSHLDPGTGDPGTGLTIRAMVESDLDGVMAIASSLATAPQWARSAYDAAIACGDGPRRIALVVERTGERAAEVIGFVVARLVAPVAEIETIAIDQKAQGYGFGSSLLLAALEELRLAGAEDVELEVRPSNDHALWFYQHAGFGEVGRRRGYYRNPDEDAVLLRLGLQSPAYKWFSGRD
jgi:ribosomal-protein-alanine N-acetyltransferase